MITVGLFPSSEAVDGMIVALEVCSELSGSFFNVPSFVRVSTPVPVYRTVLRIIIMLIKL